jgi:hypothetical protein
MTPSYLRQQRLALQPLPAEPAEQLNLVLLIPEWDGQKNQIG